MVLLNDTQKLIEFIVQEEGGVVLGHPTLKTIIIWNLPVMKINICGLNIQAKFM